MANVKLVPLEQADRNQFILDNQKAFRYGAMEEFGLRDDHFEEEGEIISRQTIEASIDGGTAYRIVQNGDKVGGVGKIGRGLHIGNAVAAQGENIFDAGFGEHFYHRVNGGLIRVDAGYMCQRGDRVLLLNVAHQIAGGLLPYGGAARAVGDADEIGL